MTEQKVVSNDIKNDDNTDDMRMCIQIVSDIHLEFKGVYDKMKQIRRGAPILCLLGDIGYPNDVRDDIKGDNDNGNVYWRFIDDMSQLFKHVIIICGNHEYYYSTMEDTHQIIKDKVKLYDNVHFLQNNTLEIPDLLPDVTIFGSTFWVDYPKKNQILHEYRINDFRRIKVKQDPNNVGKKKQVLTCERINELHHESVNALKNAIEKAKKLNRKLIVLTHHSPTSVMSIFPNYYPMDYKYINKSDMDSDGGNCKFDSILFSMNFSNMEYLFKDPIILWCFGHTHWNCDYIIKSHKSDHSIRIASNQQGYITGMHGESENYLDCKIIQLHQSIQNSTVYSEKQFKQRIIYKNKLKFPESIAQFGELPNKSSKKKRNTNNSHSGCNIL